MAVFLLGILFVSSALALSPQPEPPRQRQWRDQGFLARRFVPQTNDALPLAAQPLNIPKGPRRALQQSHINTGKLDKWAKILRPLPHPDLSGLVTDPLPGGVPGTGDREGGYFPACGIGYQFKAVDCETWSQAPDLKPEGRQYSTGVCDLNYIECSAEDRAEGQKREIYHFEVSTVSGQRAKGGDAGYYASAKIGEDRGVYPHQRFCWKRWGAGGDGCGCMCAVILQNAFAARPECFCY